jgi:hypothetical protein
MLRAPTLIQFQAPTQMLRARTQRRPEMRAPPQMQARTQMLSQMLFARARMQRVVALQRRKK